MAWIASLVVGVGVVFAMVGFWLGRWSLRRRFAAASQLARVDALTGLLNRRAFDEHLAELEAVSRRYGQGFSLVMIDLDGFKGVNDRSGHPAGDAQLQSIAQLLRQQVRDADRVFRFGGDEFAILCPCTPAAGAQVLGKRLCAEVASRAEFKVGLSVGIAEGADVVQRADAALLKCKQAGGNQACIADP